MTSQPITLFTPEAQENARLGQDLKTLWRKNHLTLAQRISLRTCRECNGLAYSVSQNDEPCFPTDKLLADFQRISTTRTGSTCWKSGSGVRTVKASSSSGPSMASSTLRSP